MNTKQDNETAGDAPEAPRDNVIQVTEEVWDLIVDKAPLPSNATLRGQPISRVALDSANKIPNSLSDSIPFWILGWKDLFHEIRIPVESQPGVEDVQAALDRSKQYTRDLYAEIQAMPLQIGSGEAVTEISEADSNGEADLDWERRFENRHDLRDEGRNDDGSGESYAERNA